MLKWITLCLIVWGASGAPSREDALCDVCHMLVGEVQDLLKVGIAKAQIKQYVRGICQRLPSDEKDVCNVIIQGHTEAVFNKMVSDLTPHQVCQKLSNVCPVPVEVLEEEPVEQFEEEPVEESVEEPMVEPLVEPLENVGDLKCDVCEFIIATLDKYIEKNSSIEAINKTLEKFCNDLPPQIGDICKQFEPDLISVLGKGLPPKTACATIRLCDAEQLESYDTPCDICYKVMGAFGLKEVESVCSKWQTCQLEEEEIERATPEEQENLGSLECDVCEFIIATLDKYIEKNSSIAAINKTLESFCTALPQQIEDICRNIEPDIIYVLGKGLPPKTACATIRLCDANVLLGWEYVLNKGVSMTKKCQNHRPETKPLHHEKETQNTDSNNTIKVKQPALSSSTRCRTSVKAEQLESYDTPCDICYKVMGAFGLKEVESVCSKWQTCQPEEEEIERATPEEQENLGTIECDICKLLVDYAEKYIEENHTIEEINATLRGFCKDLPDFLQDPEKKEDDFSKEKKEDDFSKEKKEDDFSKKKKEDDISKEKKEDDFSKEKKEDDFSKKKKEDDISKEKKEDDFSKEKKEDDFSKEKKEDDFSKENKEDDFSKENKEDDFSKEKKEDDFSKEKKADDFSKEKKKDDFSKEKNTIIVSNSLDPDQDNILSVLIWVQTVCKGYQQTTKVTASKCLNEVVPEILKVIKDDPDPATVCADIKLCDAIEESGISPCDVCFNIARRLGIEDVDSLCSKVKTCQPEEEEIEKVTAEKQENLGDLECDICKFLVDYAEKFIEENKTIAEINATLRGFCKDLPASLQDPCLNDVVPEILKVIKDDPDPATVCADIKLCDAIEESGMSPCDVCFNIARRVGLKIVFIIADKADPDEMPHLLFAYAGSMQKDVDSLCSKVKTCQPEEEEIEKVTAEEQENLGTVQCDICKLLVDIAETYVEENRTIEKLNATLRGICKELPSKDIQDKCLNEVVPKLLKELKEHRTPTSICADIDLCDGIEESGMSPCDICFNIARRLGFKDAEMMCSKWKTCQTKTEEVDIAPAMKQEETLECSLCKFLVDGVETYIEENRTIKEINSTLLNLCDTLPDSIKSTCQTVEPYLIGLLQQKIPPETICEGVGFCEPKDASAPISHVSCDACYAALETIGFKEPEAVCAKVKDCREMLASALEDYNEPEQETPVVKEMQQEENVKEDPECEVCELLVLFLDQVAKDNVSLADLNKTIIEFCDFLPETLDLRKLADARCELCKFTLGLLDGVLKKDDPKLNQTLTNLCNSLPDTYKSICLALVPTIVKEAKAGFPPQQTCATAGFCTSESSEREPFAELCDRCMGMLEGMDEEAADALCSKMCHGRHRRSVELSKDVKSDVKQMAQSLSKGTKAGGLVECEACKIFVQTLDDFLGQNKTEKTVNDTVFDICQKLTGGQLVHMCLQDAPKLVKILLNGLDPEKTCITLGLCTVKAGFNELNLRKLVKRDVQDKELKIKTTDDWECSLCELLVNVIDSYLKKNASAKEVNDTVYRVCDTLPSKLMKDLCYKMAPTLCKDIEKGFDPKRACQDFGLCLNKTTLALNPFELEDQACDVCKFLEELAAPLIPPNTTEAEVNKTLIDICNSLPDLLQKTCYDVAKDLLHAFDDRKDPEKACEDVGLCSAVAFDKTHSAKKDVTLSQKPVKPIEREIDIQPKTVGKSILCLVCEAAITTIDKDLEKNSTEKKINDTVYGACEKLPSSLKDICLSFAGLVVKELTSGLEPEKVCEAIKLCESDMKTLALNPFELKDEACDVCKLLEELAAPLINPNTTEADVNATLLSICDILPDFLQQPCDDVAKKLVQAFVDKDNPEKACEDVGLCTAVAFETAIRSPIKPKKPVKCDSCMKAMQHVYNDLFQNYPKVRSAVISKVCNKLPETYKTTCMRLSNSHLNGYWKTFLDNYTPSLLCEMAECVEQEFSFQPAKKSNRT